MLEIENLINLKNPDTLNMIEVDQSFMPDYSITEIDYKYLTEADIEFLEFIYEETK